MNGDRELIRMTKELIMNDCVDSIFVAKNKIVSYLKKHRGYSAFFSGCNSRLSIQSAVTAAVKELLSEGKVIMAGGEIRKPYNFQ